MLRWAVHLKEGPKRDYHHAPVAVGHKVYSFGGNYYRETYMDRIEVHVFNTVSLRWLKLPLTSSGVPSIRHGHTAVLIDDIIYIWGGFSYIGEDSNVLYEFDVDAHRWFKPRISGTIPGVRRDHSACALGKVMYVFGGFNWVTGCSNDIYKLDTTVMVWSLINTKGIPAHILSCHSATIIGTKMFVFGGQDNNNISVFDTETNCWLNTPSAKLIPEGRKSHSAFAYNGELYIFGGYNFDQTFYDLWRFNPETFAWKKVEPKGKGPCWRFGMCCCMVGDRIILSGLYTPDDDLYILDFRPSLKTLCKLAVTQHGLEQSGLPHAIRWELAAMTDNGIRANNIADLKKKYINNK